MKNTITFNTNKYFDGVVYYVGWILGLVAIPVAFVNWILTPIFILIALLIFTANFKLTIDTQSKKIDDYLFIAGMKTQAESFQYNTLSYIYITKSRYTQSMGLRGATSTISGEIYNAYLKSDVDNHFLGENKRLEKLEKKVRPLAEQLDLKVRLSGLDN